MSRAGTSGFLLGKFLPPHRGHQYLIEFARAYVDRLTVLACSIVREPIPGELRYRWMCEAFPGVEVIHHTDELPQAPEEHSQFWDLWRQSIRRHRPGPIDYVFASEAYGARLAHELDAEFVPVDLERRNVPVSGHAIRADPLGHWADLLPPVRPYYLTRVCVLDFAGSSLAAELAAAFDTACLHAYGGGLDSLLKAALGEAPAAALLRAHAAAEAALARQANRVLICELDALTIGILAQIRQGHSTPGILDDAAGPRSHLYIVNERMDSGEQAPVLFSDLLLTVCTEHRIPVINLRDAGRERLDQARAAVEGVMKSRFRS